MNIRRTKKLIIVVSGKKGSGKDTFGRMIGTWASDKGMRCSTVAFADQLKAFCMDVFGLSNDQCYGTDEQKNTASHCRWDVGLPLTVRLKYRKKWWHLPRSGFMTAREVLQVFGTESVRALCPNAWADATFARAMNDSNYLVVVTDGRFPNEVVRPKWMDQWMGVTFKAVRLLRSVSDDVHVSETSLDGVDPVVYHAVLGRHMTLGDYAREVNRLMTEWTREAGLEE